MARKKSRKPLTPEEKARRKQAQARRKAAKPLRDAVRAYTPHKTNLAAGALRLMTARAKTNADSDYNVRRRAKRDAARLTRIINNTETPALQRRAARATLGALQEDIAQTYAATASQEDRRAALDRLRRTYGAPRSTRSVDAAQQEARNNAFARQLNLALMHQPSALGNADEGYTRAVLFVGAFGQDYRGRNRSELYSAIMESTGADDLETVYRQTMADNRANVRQAFKALDSFDTNAYEDINDQGDAKYRVITPYLARMSYNRA